MSVGMIVSGSLRVRVWQAGRDLSFNTIRNGHYGSSWCHFSWYTADVTADYERDSWEPQTGHKHSHNLLEQPIYFHQQVSCQPAMLMKEWFHPLICHSILTQSKRLDSSYKQEVCMGNNGLLDRLHIALPGRDAKSYLSLVSLTMHLNETQDFCQILM